MELPAVTVRQIAAPAFEQSEPRLPDTGETEQIGRASAPERVIQPPFSLSGLTTPANGLTGRGQAGETFTPLPTSLQNLS